MSYGHYWLFQCDPWCLPTQKWLKNATNDISIQEFHNIITHYKFLVNLKNHTITSSCFNKKTTSSHI